MSKINIPKALKLLSEYFEGSPSKRVLLAEYEACQQYHHSTGNQVWLSTTIFLSINVALLGGVSYSIITNSMSPSMFPSMSPYIRGVILILGLLIIFTFAFWIRWLNRVQFLLMINYERIRQIENALGMWKSWLAYYLEKCGGRNSGKECERLYIEEHNKISQCEEMLKKLDKRYPHIPRWKWWNFFTPSPKYAPPSGLPGLKFIALLVMLAWAVIIFMTFLYFGY